MEVTTFKTLEAFTDHIARNCLALLPCLDDSPPVITVGAKKPFALVFASSSEVRITRRHADYRETMSAREQMTLAALAIGSNLGDKVTNIENALQLIEQPLSQVPDLVAENPLDPVLVSIVDTSFLYESTPMYVTEQPSFLNAACLVRSFY
jgi:dihydroneopterin aldolase/2-amino-4-hydroxy-6-hydroxymethyldihydropteridine diphosphokinase/dihydropteroate synthase